jgi:hypothetical protein
VVKRADARRFRDEFPELGPGRLEAPHIADDHNAEVVAVRKVRFGFTGAYLYKAALWCGPCTIKTLVVERKAAPGAIDKRSWSRRCRGKANDASGATTTAGL